MLVHADNDSSNRKREHFSGPFRVERKSQRVPNALMYVFSNVPARHGWMVCLSVDTLLETITCCVLMSSKTYEQHLLPAAVGETEVCKRTALYSPPDNLTAPLPEKN